MKTKTRQFFLGSFLLALVLLAAVPFCDFVLSFFWGSSGSEDSGGQILAGVIAETLRALISCYLYSVTEKKGSSLLHGLTHGLLYSALIGSLYLTLGYFYFGLNSPLRFLIADTSILLVQGLVSGPVLYLVYREGRKSGLNKV